MFFFVFWFTKTCVKKEAFSLKFEFTLKIELKLIQGLISALN